MSYRNALYLQLHAQTSSGLRAVLALLISLSLAAVLPATADSPGRGLTRELEISYLRYLIDYHLSELRMTELAAGALLTAPIPEIVPDAQTFPSPSYPPTGAKASLADVRSIARLVNRFVHEEILTAQTLLRDFYGINHEPSISQPIWQQRSRFCSRLRRAPRSILLFWKF